MNSVPLALLIDRKHWFKSDVYRLIEAAACVANAIQAGTGACVQGTLMEKHLRDALCLEKGQYVEIPKD